MNQAEQLHPLEEEFYKQAPSLLHTEWVKNFLWINQTVGLLRSLPKDPKFEDVYRELQERNWFQFSITGAHKIPQTWPLIVAANHPYIFADRWSIWTAIERERPDSVIKVVAESVTKTLAEAALFSEFIGETNDERLLFRERVNELLANDGTLIIYPAWQTSYRNILWQTIETPWKKWVLHFSEWNDTPILPLHVDAQTSFLYNTLRNVFSRDLVKKLNLREANRKGIHVKLSVGDVLPPGSLHSPEELKRIIYSLT